MRPLQWQKNIFIFFPPFFDHHIFEADYLKPCILMFLAYCFASSGIYCFNDIFDAEVDKDHNGLITGKFLSKNCYGKEKVNRLLIEGVKKEDFYIYAYGDSEGDKEMGKFADEFYMCQN